MKYYFFRSAIIATAITTFCGAVYFARSEYRAICNFSLNVRSTYGQAIDNPPVFANSSSGFSQLKQMETCLNLQLSIIGALFPSENRAVVARSCLNRAEQILSQSPAESIAYIVKAASLTNLAEYAQAHSNLKFARQFAPNEGWQASSRVQIAFLINRLDDRFLDETDAQDIRLMLRSDKALNNLASLYLHYTNQRIFIAGALVTAPGDLQRSFLSRVHTIIPD